MTLIVLLILAGVSLSGLFSEKGLFNRAESAGNKYNEAKARETLETVLLADGQYEKHSNPKYNQDDFLDALIKKEIPGSNVRGDIAIIGEYAYELDRSVPKIGRYLGNPKDLIFPTVTVSEPTLANDYRSATFTVTAIENKKGINKIEIWLNGEKIETLTKTYSNIKTEIKENFTVNKNGTYTIKAYGDLMASTTVEVTGIVPAVEFSPNGSTEWKKEHTTKIIVKETGERVTSLKYKWTTSSANPPQISEFTETCPADNIVTGKDFTGTYYLWIVLTTETGKINICGSEGFNFDNEAPSIELETTPLTDTSFELKSVAKDELSGIKKISFYLDNVEYTPNEYTLGINSIAKLIYKTSQMEYKQCEVEIYDTAGNSARKNIKARTQMYEWSVWNVVEKRKYKQVATEGLTDWGSADNFVSGASYTFDEKTGLYTILNARGWSALGLYRTSKPCYVFLGDFSSLKEPYNASVIYKVISYYDYVGSAQYVRL